MQSTLLHIWACEYTHERTRRKGDVNNAAGFISTLARALILSLSMHVYAFSLVKAKQHIKWIPCKISKKNFLINHLHKDSKSSAYRLCFFFQEEYFSFIVLAAWTKCATWHPGVPQDRPRALQDLFTLFLFFSTAYFLFCINDGTWIKLQMTKCNSDIKIS